MGSRNISSSDKPTTDSSGGGSGGSGEGAEELFMQPISSNGGSGSSKHGRREVLLRVLLWLVAPRGLLLRVLPEFVQGTPLLFAVGVWAGKCLGLAAAVASGCSRIRVKPYSLTINPILGVGR